MSIGATCVRGMGIRGSGLVARGIGAETQREKGRAEMRTERPWVDRQHQDSERIDAQLQQAQERGARWAQDALSYRYPESPVHGDGWTLMRGGWRLDLRLGHTPVHLGPFPLVRMLEAADYPDTMCLLKVLIEEQVAALPEG